MNINRATILALFLAAVYIPTAKSSESVVIAAAEIEARVAPRAAQLPLIDLPALDFSLYAAIDCTGRAESLTLSIADTHATLGEDVIADLRSAEAVLTVPARQVRLAADAGFCLEDDMTSRDELLVPGLATAHVSLRCRNEHGVTVHFASTALGIRLQCERPSIEDQDSSLER